MDLVAARRKYQFLRTRLGFSWPHIILGVNVSKKSNCDLPARVIICMLYHRGSDRINLGFIDVVEEKNGGPNLPEQQHNFVSLVLLLVKSMDSDVHFSINRGHPCRDCQFVVRDIG